MAAFDTVDGDGWADSIDGGDIPIIKRELPASCYEYRPKGLFTLPIVGVIYHVSAGCGPLYTGPSDKKWDPDKIKPSLETTLRRQEVSRHFGIDRDGEVVQFLSLERQARHAQQGDKNWLGVEHIGSPKCNQTKLQVATSVKVVSALINYVNSNDLGKIPIVHASGTPPYHGGIADHKQGGVFWGDHVDGLPYAPAPTWDWTEYIEQVRAEFGL